MIHDSYSQKTLHIGLAGLGIATTAMLPAFMKHPFVKITAATAKNSHMQLARFAREFDVEAFEDIESMCKSDLVDAVYIATPTQLHNEHVLIAAEHGKHIIVEKPMAITLEDAQQMIEIVEKNGVKMVVGHSHSFDPAIQKIREIVESGKIGDLKMLHNWYYNDWIYRPRLPEELDTSLGGGVTFRQGSHQFDILRLIGGGKVKSVRAHAGEWDTVRPTEGSYVVFLEFTNGVVATAVYNGYDHFHTSELTYGIGEDGQNLEQREYGKARKIVMSRENSFDKEEMLKRSFAYGGEHSGILTESGENQPFFGLTVVSCERGDIRQSPKGLYIYGEDDKFEIVLPPDKNGRDAVVEELYNAVVFEKPIIHSGRWAMANLEVCMAVLESSKQRKEIFLKHQVHLKGGI